MNAKLLDCTSGVNTSGSHHQSENTHNCLVYVTIMIITFTYYVFDQIEYIISRYFLICANSFWVKVIFTCSAVIIVWYHMTWYQTNLMY